MVYFVFRDYSYINIIRLINITMKLIKKKKKFNKKYFIKQHQNITINETKTKMMNLKIYKISYNTKKKIYINLN